MSNAKAMVDEMKKDPEKLKELEQAMELMKDPEFQKKVGQTISPRAACLAGADWRVRVEEEGAIR